jgi:hypothetical protein
MTMRSTRVIVRLATRSRARKTRSRSWTSSSLCHSSSSDDRPSLSIARFSLMTSLAHFLSCLGDDEWLKTITSAPFLGQLDVALNQACSALTRRTNNTADGLLAHQTLLLNVHIIYALYIRLVTFLQQKPLDPAMQRDLGDSLLRASRVVPFCLIFGQCKPVSVQSMLDTSILHIPSLGSDLNKQRDVYVTVRDTILMQSTAF